MKTNRTLPWLVAATILFIAALLYRSYTRSRLNVDPHAAEEIEKAKRR